jgi:hypothetical protein
MRPNYGYRDRGRWHNGTVQWVSCDSVQLLVTDEFLLSGFLGNDYALVSMRRIQKKNESLWNEFALIMVTCVSKPTSRNGNTRRSSSAGEEEEEEGVYPLEGGGLCRYYISYFLWRRRRSIESDESDTHIMHPKVGFKEGAEAGVGIRASVPVTPSTSPMIRRRLESISRWTGVCVLPFRKRRIFELFSGYPSTRILDDCRVRRGYPPREGVDTS